VLNPAGFESWTGSCAPLACIQIPKVGIQCCQPCGFPTKLGLFFCGVAGFFENLRVACFWACFNWNLLVFWACFLQIFVLPIAFSSKFIAIFCFNLFLKAFWACFCENFVILGLFFRICHHAFHLIFLLIFRFVTFSCQRMLFFFRWNYLFLVCFAYFLACFCKITWHHCWQQQQGKLVDVSGDPGSASGSTSVCPCLGSGEMLPAYWPVCEFDLTLRVLFLGAAFNVLITITAHHLPLYQCVANLGFCLPNPRSFCKIHFPSVVQCYLVQWLNILSIAWPMVRVQRGFVFNIAWTLFWNWKATRYEWEWQAVLSLLMFQLQIWCFERNFWCLMFWH